MSDSATRRAFTAELLACATDSPTIFALTSDAKGSVTLGDFEKALPNQFVDVGIAEQNAVGIAAGMARAGCTVFVCGPASFYSARALEQVKNDVAYSGTDVKIVGVSGGVAYGALGATHHSIHDYAAFRAIPGIELYLPADAAQTKAVTRYLAASGKPAYVRLGRNPVPQIYDAEGTKATVTPEAPFAPGRALTLREGADVAIISAGETLHRALAACELLDSRGIHATLLDLVSIRPVDRAAVVAAARATGCVLTVEEHSRYGGIGSLVAEIVSEELAVPVRRIGFPDHHLPSGSQTELLDAFGMSPQAIADEATDLVARGAAMST